ncbi:MAG: flagellar hook-basal body complex protein, partial [Planctomycetes bacterium]|nr:flagellar hook-basal body complex protein [Planctomycetota bacterium]
MGLSSSLFSGISGLQQHQQRLDVIGNNLANVNTIGFKSQRVLFQDQLYETLRSGTAPSGANGGTNPSQVGNGVQMGQISTNFNDGDFEVTGIDTDMA